MEQGVCELTRKERAIIGCGVGGVNRKICGEGRHCKYYHAPGEMWTPHRKPLKQEDLDAIGRVVEKATGIRVTSIKEAR